MKRQLLIAQLTMLLEQSTAQHRLRWQALSPGRLHAMPKQIRRHQFDQLSVLVHRRVRKVLPPLRLLSNF